MTSKRFNLHFRKWARNFFLLHGELNGYMEICEIHPCFYPSYQSDLPHLKSLDGLPFPSNHFDFVRIANLGLAIPEDEWQTVLEVRRRELDWANLPLRLDLGCPSRLKSGWCSWGMRLYNVNSFDVIESLQSSLKRICYFRVHRPFYKNHPNHRPHLPHRVASSQFSISTLTKFRFAKYPIGYMDQRENSLVQPRRTLSATRRVLRISVFHRSFIRFPVIKSLLLLFYRLLLFKNLYQTLTTPKITLD